MDPHTDDPRGAWTPSLGLLGIAAALAVGAVAGWWWSAPAPLNNPVNNRVAAATPAPASRSASVTTTTVAEPTLASALPSQPPTASAPLAPARVRRTREPGDDPTPDLSDYINEGERPTMADVIGRLHQAGIHSGLGAFQPPGTRPPLVGLAVPEDFELPDGYVRHHQATDDGQRIEAVLMFAPDRAFFDAAGQPIAIPKDRVVPPELAPPGLPLRRIAVPATRDLTQPGG
jgi:hypothetical protein